MGKRVFVNSCCWVIFLLVMVNTITAQQGWFKPVPTTTMKPLRAPGRATLATTTSKTTTSTTTTTTTTPTRPPPAVARRFSAVLFPSDGIMICAMSTTVFQSLLCNYLNFFCPLETCHECVPKGLSLKGDPVYRQANAFTWKRDVRLRFKQ